MRSQPRPVDQRSNAWRMALLDVLQLRPEHSFTVNAT
jgi:hypothetical protein